MLNSVVLCACVRSVLRLFGIIYFLLLLNTFTGNKVVEKETDKLPVELFREVNDIVAV